SARVAYALWTGADRPSPDHANADCILLPSAHHDTGHYFDPPAPRPPEAEQRGAAPSAVDIRLPNTASVADCWPSPHPGPAAPLLLAMAPVILDEGLCNREFVATWVNWRDFLEDLYADRAGTFDSFIEALQEHYAWATPAAAEAECGVPRAQIEQVAREIGKAGTRFASHVWRNAAAGNLGGWQVSRCLKFLTVLVGAVGTPGGTNLNTRDKFVAAPFASPPHQLKWNELLYPLEYPLAYHE